MPKDSRQEAVFVEIEKIAQKVALDRELSDWSGMFYRTPPGRAHGNRRGMRAFQEARDAAVVACNEAGISRGDIEDRWGFHSYYSRAIIKRMAAAKKNSSKE